MEKFSVYLSLPGNTIFKLLQPRLTFAELSRSAVMCLGAFIIEHFPLLAPPNLPPGQAKELKVT